jgi:hypothetical protein
MADDATIVVGQGQGTEQFSVAVAGLRFLVVTLFTGKVQFSVLGRWPCVHKATILRWVLGLALAVWPSVS